MIRWSYLLIAFVVYPLERLWFFFRFSWLSRMPHFFFVGFLIDVARSCARSVAAAENSGNRFVGPWENDWKRHNTGKAKCLVVPWAVRTDTGSLKTSTFTEYRRPSRPSMRNAELCGYKQSIERTGMMTPSGMRESAALISYQAGLYFPLNVHCSSQRCFTCKLEKQENKLSPGTTSGHSSRLVRNAWHRLQR